MRTVVDSALRLEASEYRLRFTCEHCAHFDVAGERCAEGFPSEPHREGKLEHGQSLEFCKSFELA